jgi:hypothetical protein
MVTLSNFYDKSVKRSLPSAEKIASTEMFVQSIKWISFTDPYSVLTVVSLGGIVATRGGKMLGAEGWAQWKTGNLQHTVIRLTDRWVS